MSENDKAKVNTSPEIEVGTAEDVDAIMKKYDRESNVRIWEGTPKLVIRVLLALFAIYLVWVNLFSTQDERFRRPVFMGLIILFVFLIYPMRKGATKVNYIPWYDIVLAVLGAGSFFFYAANLNKIVDLGTRINAGFLLNIGGTSIPLLIVLPPCSGHPHPVRRHGVYPLRLHAGRKIPAHGSVQPVLHHHRHHRHPHRGVFHLHCPLRDFRRFPGGHRHRQLLH